MGDWQPISTAPKDGTEVDLWGKQWVPGGQFIYKRFPGYRWVTSPPHWTAYPRENSRSLSGWEATHWMLPPAPPPSSVCEANPDDAK